MAGAERRPNVLTRAAAYGVEKTAEISKFIDKATILAGGGLYLIGYTALGFVLIVGSVVTLIPGSMAQRWARKIQGKQ